MYALVIEMQLFLGSFCTVVVNKDFQVPMSRVPVPTLVLHCLSSIE
jgi:hypothetical protein